MDMVSTNLVKVPRGVETATKAIGRMICVTELELISFIQRQIALRRTGKMVELNP